MNIEKMDLALQNLLMEKYRQLYLIRQVELSIGEYSRKGVFRTPVHLAIGQEAIAVGVSTFLRNTDYVFHFFLARLLFSKPTFFFFDRMRRLDIPSRPARPPLSM